MPQSGSGAGKSEEFYAVCEKFPDPYDWLQFARGESYLNIPGNKIENIRHDYSRSIQEQKYQMLLVWEQRLGRDATVDRLKMLVDNYLGRPTNRSHSDCVGQGIQQQPVQENQPPTRDKQRFRNVLLKISTKLNDPDLDLLKDCYGVHENIPLKSLLFHLENNNKWSEEDLTIPEKLEDLKEKLLILEKHNLISIIDEARRTFEDYRGDNEVQAPNGNQQHEANEQPSIQSVDGNEATTPSSVITAQSNHCEAPSTFDNSAAIPQQLIGREQPYQGIVPFFEDPTQERCFDQSTTPPYDPTLDDICTYNGTSVNVTHSTRNFYREKQREVVRRTVYKVSQRKGCALIISNVNFSVGPNWYRRGGENDCLLMKNLFGKDGLGLDVTVKEDLTAKGMRANLRQFSQSSGHDTASMCVVLIMSHGHYDENSKRSGIYGADGEIIDAEDDVIRYFDNGPCPRLKGKPKMFFFQFCRGDTADRGVCSVESYIDSSPSQFQRDIEESFKRLDLRGDEVDNAHHYPSRSDMLIAYSTQEGDLSFRGWFTNALANVFSKKAHDHSVCDMLKEVKRGLLHKVSQSSNSDHNRCKAMADVRDILVKNIYFFPGFP